MAKKAKTVIETGEVKPTALVVPSNIQKLDFTVQAEMYKELIEERSSLEVKTTELKDKLNQKVYKYMGNNVAGKNYETVLDEIKVLKPLSKELTEEDEIIKYIGNNDYDDYIDSVIGNVKIASYLEKKFGGEVVQFLKKASKGFEPAQQEVDVEATKELKDFMKPLIEELKVVKYRYEEVLKKIANINDYIKFCSDLSNLSKNTRTDK